MKPGSKKVWRTKEGREMAVEEMEDSHVINAIRVIERMCNGEANAVKIINMALACWKPTMQQMIAIRKMEYIEKVQAGAIPINYWMLRDEAQRRNLWLPKAIGERPANIEEELAAEACASRLFNFT